MTRVPETISEAKRVIEAVSTEYMEDIGDCYRIFPLGNTYAGIRQRWLLIYSQQAYARESKGLDKRVAQTGQKAEKEWLALQRKSFPRKADAQAALTHLAQCLPWHTPLAQITSVKKYAKPGRPSKDAVARTVGWQVNGQLTIKETVIEDARQWLGRFIVATNILDEDLLSDCSLLNCYKEQSISVSAVKNRAYKNFVDNVFMLIGTST